MTHSRVTHDLRVHEDAQEVAVAAAAWVAEALESRVRVSGRASFVLAGGSTPRSLYEQLATVCRPRVSWPSVHMFFGDERYVPHVDHHSNYRMAKDSLLDPLGIPAANIHPMPTSFDDPREAAQAYEAVIDDYFARTPPVFDVVLLGVGEEGHVASVFPDSAAIVSTRMVMAVTVPANPPSRLTLTLPALASARHVGVVATGARKAHALADALDRDDADTPAARLARMVPSAVWWIDRAAAFSGGPR